MASTSATPMVPVALMAASPSASASYIGSREEALVFAKNSDPFERVSR